MTWMKHKNELYNLRAFSRIRISSVNSIDLIDGQGDIIEINFDNEHQTSFAFKQIYKELGAEDIE